jgi:hypothetical protein
MISANLKSSKRSPGRIPKSSKLMSGQLLKSSKMSSRGLPKSSKMGSGCLRERYLDGHSLPLHFFTIFGSLVDDFSVYFGSRFWLKTKDVSAYFVNSFLSDILLIAASFWAWLLIHFWSFSEYFSEFTPTCKIHCLYYPSHGFGRFCRWCWVHNGTQNM